MNAEIISMLEGLPERFGVPDLEGTHPSDLPGVKFFRSTQPMPRQPLMYSPGLVIIGQGHKVGYLNGKEFTYGKGSYLILSVPLPFECQSFASEQEPVLGVFVELEASRVRQVLAAMQDTTAPAEAVDQACLGVEPAPLDATMQEVVLRLLRCLENPSDSRVLGASIVDEMIYRALQGPHSHALKQLAAQQSTLARVAKVLDYVHIHYAEPIAVEFLAQQSAMSPSSFFRAFSDVTGDSPLQYIKKVRLDKALSLLQEAPRPVSDVAYQVGYESPSQFSREFKRYFSMSPTQLRKAELARA